MTITKANTATLQAATLTTSDSTSEAAQQLLHGANKAKLPAAPLQLIALPAPHDLSLPADGFCPVPPPVVGAPKTVTEYPLPGARQTHEMAVVGDNMVVVTQQTDSTLVKVQLSPVTGRPISCSRFALGDYWAGLHGLAASQAHPGGHVWATMQFKSVLVRINAGLDQATPPVVEQVIALPNSVYGPHCVCEMGADLWVSCKDSGHVLRISHEDTSDFSIYPCSRRPIFIAMHPTSGDVYASLDSSSKIWRLVPSSGETTEVDVDATKGNTPVGLVAGTDGNVWFTLLGGSTGGTGTFARISAAGKIDYFALTTTIAATAGLIHLAFDWDHDGNNSRYIRIWLLASSLVASAGYSLDAIFSVVFDTELSRLTSQHSIVLPTQLCATHRVLPHRTGLFVSQLSVSSLAHITGAAAMTPEALVGETTDMYSDFGLGQSYSHYVFSESHASRGSLLGPAIFPLTTGAIPALPASSSRGSKRPRITAAAAQR